MVFHRRPFGVLIFHASLHRGEVNILDRIRFLCGFRHSL